MKKMINIKYKVTNRMFNQVEYLKNSGVDIDSLLEKQIKKMSEEIKNNPKKFYEDFLLFEKKFKNESNAENQHEWQVRNREKNKDRCKEYKRNHPEKLKEYRQDNKEKIRTYSKEYHKKWYLKNREEILKKQKERYIAKKLKDIENNKHRNVKWKQDKNNN
jgi:hypothetical protein